MQNTTSFSDIPVITLSSHDIDRLTVFTPEDEEIPGKVKRLKSMGNPREDKPLPWIGEILLYDMIDPYSVFLAKAADEEVYTVPGTSLLLPSEGWDLCSASTQALYDLAGVEIELLSLTTRYITKTIDLDSGTSIMRSTWILPHDFTELDQNSNDFNPFDFSKLISNNSLEYHYNQVFRLLSNMV